MKIKYIWVDTIMGKRNAIEQEIADIVQLLSPKQKKTVLTVVKTFAEERKDWWNELSEQQITAIKAAEAELAAGKGIAHDKVLKKYSKWL